MSGYIITSMVNILCSSILEKQNSNFTKLPHNFSQFKLKAGKFHGISKWIHSNHNIITEIVTIEMNKLIKCASGVHCYKMWFYGLQCHIHGRIIQCSITSVLSCWLRITCPLSLWVRIPPRTFGFFHVREIIQLDSGSNQVSDHA